MSDLAERWGSAYAFNKDCLDITDEEVREAFSMIFQNLAWKIRAKGDVDGDHPNTYYNAIPSKIEIRVDRDNRDRRLVVTCTGDNNILDRFI